MKYRLLLLFLFTQCVARSQGYLVTTEHDTVRFSHAIEVEGTKSWHWKEITYDSITYPTSNILMLKLDGQEYHVIKNRLWKKVISGKINVFALSEKDTITTRKGKLDHDLMMQASPTDRYQRLSLGALAKYSNQIDLHNIHRATGNRIARSSLTAVGFATTAIGVLVSFTGLLQQALGETQESKQMLLAGVSTTGLGTGLIHTGVNLEKQYHTMPLLDYVRLMNAE